MPTPARLFVTLGLALLTAACAGLTSQTQIPAGQTFLLGGEQRSTVRVEGRNAGPVAVELLKEVDGQRTPLATAQPGHLFSRSFAPGERVLLRNTSAERTAVVNLEVNGDVSRLPMSYDKP